MLYTIVIILLVLFLLGLLPVGGGPFIAHNWGMYPSGGLGLLLIVVVIILLVRG